MKLLDCNGIEIEDGKKILKDDKLNGTKMTYIRRGNWLLQIEGDKIVEKSLWNIHLDAGITLVNDDECKWYVI